MIKILSITVFFIQTRAGALFAWAVPRRETHLRYSLLLICAMINVVGTFPSGTDLRMCFAAKQCTNRANQYTDCTCIRVEAGLENIDMALPTAYCLAYQTPVAPCLLLSFPPQRRYLYYPLAACFPK
jgi:hypothetical protein